MKVRKVFKNISFNFLSLRRVNRESQWYFITTWVGWIIFNRWFYFYIWWFEKKWRKIWSFDILWILTDILDLNHFSDICWRKHALFRAALPLKTIKFKLKELFVLIAERDSLSTRVLSVFIKFSFPNHGSSEKLSFSLDYRN